MIFDKCNQKVKFRDTAFKVFKREAEDGFWEAAATRKGLYKRKSAARERTRPYLPLTYVLTPLLHPFPPLTALQASSCLFCITSHSI